MSNAALSQVNLKRPDNIENLPLPGLKQPIPSKASNKMPGFTLTHNLITKTQLDCFLSRAEKIGNKRCTMCELTFFSTIFDMCLSLSPSLGRFHKTLDAKLILVILVS